MLEKLMQEIINAQVLPQRADQWSQLKGGTNSTVGVVGTSDTPRMFVVKANEPSVIAAETRFYGIYQGNPLFPAIRYVDPEHRYYIYDYIPGDTDFDRRSKPALMAALAERILRGCQESDIDDGFEWVEDPAHAAGHLDYWHSVIGDRFSQADHEVPRRIQARRSRRLLEQKRHYVLHGDFGVHNFLFSGGRLRGVIDPLPKIGRPLYDLLYAFCSSPDDLQLPILLQAVEHAGLLPADRTELIEDMVMALYARISTCLTYHGDDFSRYREAWSDWVQLLSE